MKDKKRFFIRLATVLVLIGIAVLMYFLGRGHTVYFDNRKLEYDGVRSAAHPSASARTSRWSSRSRRKRAA